MSFLCSNHNPGGHNQSDLDTDQQYLELTEFSDIHIRPL